MLSNKLTFSLAFLVMLAMVAMPVFAQTLSPSYTATHDENGWDINIYIPIASGDVELNTSNELEFVGTALVAADTSDTEDGLSGISFTGITGNNPGLTGFAAAHLLQSGATPPSTGATRVGNAAWRVYFITNADPTTTTRTIGGSDVTFDNAASFTLTGYQPVTLAGSTLSANDTAVDPADVAWTALSPSVDSSDPTGQVSGSVTWDLNDGRFLIIPNVLTATDEGVSVGNGIRLGTKYVNPDAVKQPNTWTGNSGMPNIAEFFALGGTIKITSAGLSPGDIYITEVMWGEDASPALDGDSDTTRADAQWIEIYYAKDDDDVTSDKITSYEEGTEITVTVTFVPGALDTSGLDHVSNLYLGRWNPPGNGGRSQYSPIDGSAPISLVSMYRKRNLARDGSGYAPRGKATDKKFAAGELSGSWAASETSMNMSGAFVGTPGHTHILPHVTIGANYLKTEVKGDKLQFSEVRNDTSADDVDWIEIRNVSSEPQQLEDIEISVVTGFSRHDLYAERGYHKTDPRYEAAEHEKAIVGHDNLDNKINNRDPRHPENDVKRFPKWELPAGAYLLIVNRDPAETNLASGKNIELLADKGADQKINNKGAGFYYFVTPHLTGRLGGLLVMRGKLDKNEFSGKSADANILDLAGGGRFADNEETARYNFQTEVWPLRGWKDPGGPKPNLANEGVWNFDHGGAHEWWKSKGSNSNGVGYDPGVDLRYAKGTPGYPNGVVKGKSADVKNGVISFSEIMFDASVNVNNDRWNLVQWIELYNSSMMEAVNLRGWRLEIRNSNDHVDSFVDSSFIFNDAIIQPNQTLLIVSARATNLGISDNRVYNLYTQHARELGLANRRANLLSPAGFYLKLVDSDSVMVDEAGNVTVNGAQRDTQDWEAMPPPEDAVRRSLIRQYGTRVQDGTPDPPAVGTMEDGWIVADLDGGGATYYGHRGDIATPGFRTGGPLPVSLSSFRPARDKATGEVVVRWITQSELNNAGFNILRSETKNGEFKVVNVKGIIAGHGTTSEKHVYEWKDTSAKPNVVYYYQIEDVSLDGKRTLLTTTRLKGHVSAAGKVTTTWGDLKHRD